jgi:AcrR family transcriptional regulator
MSSARSASRGRPRAFDVDEALERAMHVFWRQGYEGASLTDLTAAMRISRTSMYAAFGNKEELFVRVLQRYTEGPASNGLRALAEPTAQRVAAAFLRGSIETATAADCPAGCLGVQGALAAGEPAREIRDMLVAWRNEAFMRLRDRFDRALVDEDMPAGTDPVLLARYVITVSNGIAVQAATGTSPEELQQVADAALANWPPM